MTVTGSPARVDPVTVVIDLDSRIAASPPAAEHPPLPATSPSRPAAPPENAQLTRGRMLALHQQAACSLKAALRRRVILARPHRIPLHAGRLGDVNCLHPIRGSTRLLRSRPLPVGER